MQRFRRTFLAGALGVSAIVALPAAEAAATAHRSIIVDPAHPMGDCRIDSSCIVATLSEAVSVANAHPGSTISLSASTHVLSSTLTITAAGTRVVGWSEGEAGSAANYVVDAAGRRAFRASAPNVRIRGVKIINAHAGNANGAAVLLDRNVSGFELLDSEIVGRRDVVSARFGAGLSVSVGAEATVRGTTFVDNRVDRKGGAIRVDGTLNLVNSTFTRNSAQSGGAISVAGAATISFSTFVDNTSNNSSGAGVDRNGGTVLVTGSILTRSNQQSADGSDCSGNPDLIGVNYVGNAQGCNPGPSVLIGTDPDVGILGLGVLGDHTGPTRTIPLPDGSAAVDAVPVAECAEIGFGPTFGSDVGVDQRGVVRPQGIGAAPACDIGAYEVGDIDLDVALSSSTPTPFVGADFLPADQIARNVLVTDALFDGSLAASPLSAFPLDAAPLSAFPLSAFPLSAFPLSAFPLSAFTTAQAPLSAFPLSAFPLSAFPLSAFPLSDLVLTDSSWDEVLAGTDFEGVPAHSLTLDDVDEIPQVAALSLDSLNLEGTPLSAFPLSAFLLNSIPLSAFPLSAFDADGSVEDWCDLDFATDFCAVGNVEPNDPDFTLASLALAGVPLSAFPLSAFPLSAFPLSAFPLSAFPLSAFPLSAFQLEASPLSAFPLSAFPLSAFDSGLLVCGTSCDRETGTLSDVTFRVDATLSDLAAAMLASCPPPVDGDLSTTAASCAPALGDFTVADLLAGLIPAGVVPWEQLDLDVPGLQNAADPDRWAFDYHVDLTLSEPADSLTLELALPARFAYVPGSATLDGNPVAEPGLVCLDPDSPDCLGGRTVATFTFVDVLPGSHRLEIGARAGFRVQQGAVAEATGVATSGTATDEAADTHAVDVLAPPDGGVVVIPSVGSRCADVDGDVNLGWSAAETDDIDLYSFTVTEEAARCGLRADIFLSNLPVDFDLTLYGRMTTALRGPNTSAIPYLDDVMLDLDPFDDVIQADTVQDIPQRLSAPGVDPDVYGVVAVSSNRGTEDERIRTGTLRPGTYYLQVSAYNGVTSNEPYALRIRTDGSVEPLECSALVPPPAGHGELPNPGALATGVNTLFLVNEQLLEYQYPTEFDSVLENLARFDGDGAEAAQFGVIGAIIPVDGSATVRDAYAARFADPCDPFASNDVVRAIGAVIDEYTDVRPSIANVVIVGDDRQIPMANIVDDANFANERTFAQDFDQANEGTAAIAAGMYRSDDPYGTDSGIRARDHELFVPDRAVGRLVESPLEINAALDNFIDFGGRLDPDSTRTAFQSGYEFLEDGADLNATNLEQGGYGVDRLFGPTWTDRDLADDLDTGLGSPYDVIGIHAHFDQANALPAYDNFNPALTGPELFSTDELPDGVDRAVVYSMGCHSGWSASDVQIGLDTPDWAQALTGARANVFAGNTGYGYGDTERVALTEQLTALFADEIAQDGAIGAAWVDAKQRMARDILVLDAYQEKALQQFVLYGLPMFHVGSDPVDLRPSPQAAIAAEVAEAPIALDTDPSGQPIWTVDIMRSQNDFVRNVVNDPESGVPLGAYFSLDDRTLNVNGHPIQPLHAADLPAAAGLVARDALITQLSSVNLNGDFDPVFFHATPNFGGPRAEFFDGSFPAEMAAVRTSRQDGSMVQQALFAAGQYKASDDDPNVGTQRLHPSLVAEVYYADVGGTDFTPPLIDRSEGFVDDDAALFRLSVDDTAERVYVLYRPQSATVWTGLDLVLDADSGEWRGVGTIAAGGQFMEYIVQAVDDAGNVAISNNKSQYFLGAATSVSNLELTIADTPAPVNGWYTADVTVEATNDGLSDISYRLGAGPFQTYDPVARITIDASGEPGERLVTAIDRSGAFAALLLQIDAEPPTVAVVTPIGWSQGPVEVEITADDGAGSGVARIEYSLDGEVYLPYDDENRPEVTDEGVTVRARSYDVAGNISAVTQRAIRIDSSAPTALIGLIGPDASGEVAYGAPVTASPDCTDALSGVVSCVLTVDDVVYTGINPIVLPSDALGTFRVVVTATDAVGFTTTDSVTYTIVDETPPVATVTVTGSPFGIGTSPAATYSCTDVLSSIDSCRLTVALTVAPNTVLGTDSTSDGAVTTFDLPAALPAVPDATYTVTVLATDAAGNTSSASTTYRMVDDVEPTPTLVSLSITQAGVDDPVFATFSCDDAHSAIETCELTVVGTDFSALAPAGAEITAQLPTDASGVFTVLVTATDVYGNTASTTETYQYQVIDRVCVRELYDPTQAKTIGSNYTIKIEICDGAGKNISSRNIVLEAFAITDAAGNEYDPGANDSGNANDGFLFRYSNREGYIYNLDTAGYTGPTGQTLTLDFTATQRGTVIGIGSARLTLSP